MVSRELELLLYLRGNNSKSSDWGQYALIRGLWPLHFNGPTPGNAITVITKIKQNII